MVSLDSGGKDGDPKARISVWFAISIFGTIVAVIFYIADLSGRLTSVEHAATECKTTDTTLTSSIGLINEKLGRIDERQIQIVNRMDNISANLRAHISGERGLNRFPATPQGEP